MKALTEQAVVGVLLTSHWLSNRVAQARPGRSSHGVPCVLRPDPSGGEDDGGDEEVSEGYREHTDPSPLHPEPG